MGRWPPRVLEDRLLISSGLVREVVKWGDGYVSPSLSRPRIFDLRLIWSEFELFGHEVSSCFSYFRRGSLE